MGFSLHLRNQFPVLALLISVFFGFPGIAQAGTMAGGGGSFVLIDGKLVVADPYYSATPTAPGIPSHEITEIKSLKYAQLPVELRTFMEQVLGYLDRQGLWSSHFLDNQVKSGNIILFQRHWKPACHANTIYP
jgi:hypothetical protein